MRNRSVMGNFDVPSLIPSPWEQEQNTPNNSVMQGFQFGQQQPNQPTPAAAGTDASSFSTMQRWLGGTNDAGAQTAGFVPTAMNVGGGLLQGYLGMKQYGLAKRAQRDQRRQFNLNYDAQRQTLNTQLRDRQNARVARDPSAQDTDSYMKENQIRSR